MVNIDIPELVFIGDTIELTISLGDYPANDGWALQIFGSTATANQEMANSASGADFLIDEDTSDWVAGEYHWAAFVTKAGNRQMIAQGEMSLKGDITSGAVDVRTHEMKVLDSLKAMLEDKATTDDAETAIDGQMLKRYTYEELLKFKTVYSNIVTAQRRNTERQQGKTGVGLRRVAF